MTFLDDLYTLIDRQQTEQATDLIYRTIDSLLRRDNYKQIDRILQQIDVNRLPTTAIRSLLVVTHSVKQCFLHRKKFYEAGFARVVQLKGEGTARSILERLE